MANPPAMTFSPVAAAAEAINAAPYSTLSPHAAPYTFRARPVRAPPELGDASRPTDDGNLEWLAAYFGMESCDTVYPGSVPGVQSQPSSSSGIHDNVYSSSAASTSGYTWMASHVNQEQFPSRLREGRSGNKSTKVTIKCPPNRSANDNGHSQGTMELNPVLKPLCIPSARASSPVSVVDDVNPDPSERSVDSPCYQGVLASRVSSLDVPQTSDAQPAKQELVDSHAGKASTVQDCEVSTEIKNLVASKNKQNHSHPHVELRLSEKHVHVGTKLKNDSHGKESENAQHDAGRCNAEHIYSLEVRNNCIKQSGLNSAAPDFIPSSVRKSSSGNAVPSSITSHGSCSSTARNTSEILKAIKSLSELLQTIYSDDIELQDSDLSLLSSIIDDLKSYLYKPRKGPAKVSYDKAGLRDCHFQNSVSKPVAVSQNGTYTTDKAKGIVVSNVADYSHPSDDVGRNSLTGYQPASNNLRKELSYEDDHSQVHIFKNLWFDAVRTNCTLKYQLKQTLMKIEQESSMAHYGDVPRNPFQLCDMVSDPSSSVGLALTRPPIIKDHPGVRRIPNLIYVDDYIHSGDNNVLSRSKDYVPKNIQGEYFLSDLEETSLRRGLQLVPNKFLRGLNSSISDGLSSHSYNTGRDGILPTSSEFGSSDWEHVLKDEII